MPKNPVTFEKQKFELSHPCECVIKLPIVDAKYGVTRCQVEPIYKRGIIVKLLVTFRQIPQWQNKIWELDLQANDIMIEHDAKRLTPMIGWCRDHKATFINFCVYGTLVRFSRTSTCIITIE